MEPAKKTPRQVAKKLWQITRVVFFMLKRGNKLAGKAIDSWFLAFLHGGCRPTGGGGSVQFVSPRRLEYEFSCSNSPAVSFYPFNRKSRKSKTAPYNDAATVAAVQRMVMEMLNNHGSEVYSSPSPLVGLPGFGVSTPAVRQLRITDSPFPVKDDGDSGQVDVAAEEFIKRFYKDLKRQRATSFLESPSPYHHSLWAR